MYSDLSSTLPSLSSSTSTSPAASSLKATSLALPSPIAVPPSEPLLRRATRSDIAALYALELSSFDPGMAFNRRQIAALVRNPRADVWLLASEHEAVAQVIALRQKRRSGLFARIYSITVAPAYRGLGYARQLLRWELAQLEAEGVQEICLEVEATALAPIKLYASFDFVVQRQLENYYGEGRHGIKMLKTLRTL